ncbi:dermonecrotic toxin domain-containing protein [Luteibacter yeojuensis]
MDMLPPEAPPASTQAVYEQAASAFDRLSRLQAWLATEQAGMPALPDTIGDAAWQPYLADVDAYWHAAPTDIANGVSRRALLAERLAGAAADLALLGHEDGVLDDRSFDLVRTMVATRLSGVPPHIEVRELTLGGTAYSGILLVHDTRARGPALMFSSGRGWESFPSIADAHAEMERRVRLALVSAPGLPGMAQQHTVSLCPDPFVASRATGGDPFAAFVDRIIQTQRDKLGQAWFEFALAGSGDALVPVLIDTVEDALRMEHALDVASVLARRHASLIDTFNRKRLARAPAPVAADWAEAEDIYASTRDSIIAASAEAGLQTLASLPVYAAEKLGERLRAMGVSDAPGDILVRIDRSTDAAARLESLQALFQGPAPADIRLLDLAYQNIATFDPVRLSAHASDGTPIASLDDRGIRTLVRELDLATHYRADVDATYRSGAQAAIRRTHASHMQLAHMRLQAAEARLSYYLNDLPRSFRPDRADRGYRWVEAAIDSPAASGRARVENHEVVVRQITYLGTPLRDIVSIGVRDPRSVPSIVLYTPDAPDGVTYREFDDRAEAGRLFFYHPAFREYLLDRLPAEYARVLPNGNTREFAGDRLAHWVLGSSTSSAYTQTQAPFDEREVTADFTLAAYDIDIQLGLRNIQNFTRSAERAQWSWLVDWPRSIMSHKIVRDAMKGIALAPVHVAQSSWRLYDSVKAGDSSQAFVDFADFYVASLGLLPFHSLGATSTMNGIVGARFLAAGRLTQARPAVQAVVVFEPRFAAQGVRKSGKIDHEGIFTIQRNKYIEHDGQLYAVRYDSDYATWRLTRPNTSVNFHGPAIQRTPGGQWAYHRVGLRGGMDRGAATNAPSLFSRYTDELERAFPEPMVRDRIGTRMRNRMGGQIPEGVTTEQYERWLAAVERARVRTANEVANTPSPTLPIDLSPSGYLQVPAANAPPVLWYYGRLPYTASDLIRPRTANRGRFSTTQAQINGNFIDRNMHGIRLTTVPPTAPIGEIRNAAGIPDLTHATGFVVRIETDSVYAPLAANWRDRFWLAGNTPVGELFTANRGPANVFFVRSNYGSSLPLGAHQFDVFKLAPPD